MSKVEIPSATSMAELAAEKQLVFERSVMEGPGFRKLIQKIEDAALNGRSSISVEVENFEHRRFLNIMVKNLNLAGYSCKFEGPNFPFKLFTHLTVSWGSNGKLKEELEEDEN